MFITGSGTQIDFADIPQAILEFKEKTKNFDSNYSIIIGTDSQNRDTTKIVSVICVLCHGHGGVFFYEITKEPLIKDVRQKLYKETALSLTIADNFIGVLEDNEEYEDIYLEMPISIHVDAGNSPKGKTFELIPEIVGWIKAYGYEAEVKPDSFVASTIADRISK